MICHLNLEDFCAMILDPNFGQCLMANKLNLYVDPTPVLLIARKYSPMLPFLNISKSLNMLDWCRSKVSKDLKPFPCNIGLYCNNYNETKSSYSALIWIICPTLVSVCLFMSSNELQQYVKCKLNV